jgi:hypothetical protein
MPVVSMCKPVVAVKFAPVYMLLTPPEYGVLLAVVEAMAYATGCLNTIL